MVTSLFDIGYAFGASPISRLLLNLYARQLAGGSVMPDCQPFSIAFNRLTMPGFHQFACLFEVAHFERIGGSLCSGLVAQYGADYSTSLPWRSILLLSVLQTRVFFPSSSSL
jgi:hypothetical protein